MKVKDISLVISECAKILKEVALVDVTVGESFIKTSPFKSQNVIVTIGFTGETKGQFSLSLSEKVVLNIVSNMMGGMDIVQLDELAQSAICELTNIMFGHVATALFNDGLNINIAPPILVIGNEILVSVGKLQITCIPLLIDEDNVISIDIAVLSDE